MQKQAGYMAAPERFAESQIPLAPRAPSIHGPSRTWRDVRAESEMRLPVQRTLPSGYWQFQLMSTRPGGPRLRGGESKQWRFP
jgi:hypothetical protein